MFTGFSEKPAWVGLFSAVFSVTIVLPLKAKRGGSPYIFTSMKFL